MSKASVPSELVELREQIDRLDHALVLLLANRFALTRRVGEIKAQENLDSFDADREHDKLLKVREFSEKHGLNPDLAGEILAGIMREVVENHERIRAQQEP